MRPRSSRPLPAAAFNLAASIPERILLLDSLEQELEFRLKQLEREWNTRELKPVFPNDCGFSTTDRGDRMFGKAVREKAVFERAVFSEEIAWPYHYGSAIPVNHLTTDSLYIEDAVGKASSGQELFNAHWVAHLYGAEQTLQINHGVPVFQDSGPVVGNVDVHNIPAAFVPSCLFNNLSLQTRRQFIAEHHYTNGNAWRIHFAHFDPPSPATANGYLEIRLNNDFFELQFGFTAQNMGATITPAMQAFLIKNAVTVLDGLWAQEFAVEGFKRYDPFFQPGTQDSLSYTREINRRFTSPAHVLSDYALESL